ncbi:LOW QUALITY PROTEIN: uncharacterized protein ACR2FA_009981 [Aphomia sociella]
MMFSMEKCSGLGGRGTSEDSELFAGGGEALGKEGVSDEVASAVAAVSDEIGDILKDELGDADRVDRIGAELADLSAELGLLAGLADGEQQQDFPSVFEIAMGQRASGSGSSSSSWSGPVRRRSRPQRAPRRRPIAKGKEMSRRRSVAARRASLRLRREPASDASDVGADSDSDDQWTELDDASGSSDSSSLKNATGVDVDCNGFQHKGAQAEAPAMGQFLLPLLSADPATPEAEHFLIRHEDILQLLASAEEGVREELPLEEDSAPEPQLDTCAENEDDEDPITPEEEAALLHYVCAVERTACSPLRMAPVPDWLLGVYHSWCEISALINTLVSTNMSAEMAKSEWIYRVRFGCHCRLCLCLANNAAPLGLFIGDVVWALAHGGSSAPAAGVVRALRLRAHAQPAQPAHWDLARLRTTALSDDGAAIMHEQLMLLSQESEITKEIVQNVCLCRQFDRPLEKEYAMERFCKILENFKAASTMTFKVEMVPAEGGTLRVLAPPPRCSTSERLRDMAARTAPAHLSAWSGYKHRCDSYPRTLCAQQRRQLLRLFYSRISFFGIMQAVNEFSASKQDTELGTDSEKPPSDMKLEMQDRELQQGDGTGAKPPDSTVSREAEADAEASADAEGDEHSDNNLNADFDDMSDSDASLGLSTSSSLDSASELLLAAAAAVESAGSEGEAAPRELCRTVRHLMRSIASIERLMDRVLKHCDEWPAPPNRNDHEARKRVDMGLSEVDRKLMAMYRRLPEVHRRQLQVYRKQKKLSTVCMQLVGGRAPAPPPPGSPPPAPPRQPCRALCPEYHLRRFKEVRRKVMHMRDQQLYYHRLRMWLEEQLRQERESLPDTNVTLVEDLPRRKRRTASPKLPRLTTAAKRKLKPPSPLTRPHKILQMLKHKTPTQNQLHDDLKDDIEKSEVEAPEAFPLEREDNISDTETIVGEKETELCKDMKECLAKFANFALSNDQELRSEETKYPESVSPPLQETSPTNSEPLPVYTPKPSQRLLTVNKFLNRSDYKTENIDFQIKIAPDINVPLNARRTPVLIKDDNDKEINLDRQEVDSKDPNIYKYVTFGLEIKKAMEECQNIINSYNIINKDKDKDGSALSLEQICEVMINLDKNSAEFLEKIDSDEPLDINVAISKLAKFVENMPEIATKLTEFANASFELPEFASIMNSLPDENSEAQLTPETLKQIRELKLNKNRDSIKVTKNTAKRKTNRRKNDEFIGTMTFELDSQDITDLLKDEKDIPNLIKNKTNNKDYFNDLLFSISAQVVINKVFEYLKQNKSPVLAKCLEEDGDLFALPKNSINSEMYSKASTLFDNSVKDALSLDDLRELVRSRFDSWKHYVATKFKSIPVELLENEIEAMLDKFYSYVQDLASKQWCNETDKIVEKIDELRKNKDFKDSDSDNNTSKESLQQITKLLSTSAGNTFDLLIMKLSNMAQDKKSSVKSLKFKYIDVIKRCAESQQLSRWILVDPEIAAYIIQELTGLPVKKTENLPDFSTLSNDKKKDYFIERLREMNKLYMETLPKKALTGDEWLVMLYRLEQLEERLKEAFAKVTPPTKCVQTQSNASEGEILAAKGLSKIIGKSNTRVVKKPEAKPVKKEEKETDKEKEEDEKKSKNEALLAKCEAILTSKGEKSLLESFYTIKSYITQGLPVPETYKKHVISICSSIDAKFLDEDIEETLKVEDGDKEKLSVIGSHNPELLAKYSAQALRNAKQTLNAVAFKNMAKNGQAKSDSDVCDTPKSDCKWTNDCVCSSCKDADSNSVCLGDIVKQCYDKGKSGLEEKKKEVKTKPPTKQVKPQPKCEGASHQQHVCKVGHSPNGNGGCAGDGAADQPCTCCYCTVFGHAPPLTTPVPRNYNETRERLRSILNKKKQQCKTNGEQGVTPSPFTEKKQAVMQTQPTEQPKQNKPPQPAPKPPALPKTLPPNLTATQAQQKRQTIDTQQKQLADKMAKMVVTEKPENKPKTLQSTVPIQVSVPPAVKSENKVNQPTVEQIRLQQIKQQQQQQLQQQTVQQQKKTEPIYDLPIHKKPQSQQQNNEQQVRNNQQQKTEPIYDLPIHKPTLTAEQQIIIRKKQQQLQQQQQHQQQQHQQQLQQQQQHQQQLQQQQLQQQQLHQQQMQQQQRQSRQQQQRTTMSLSSRESSVYSTSSGCSGGSCWRGGAGPGAPCGGPRDLDALLQYIEGPARHVDRGKKRAKKLRQKGKRMEIRLLEERAELEAELDRLRRDAAALLAAQSAQEAARRRLDEARLAHQQQQGGKKKGKKQKMNPAQQAKMMMMAEKLGELNTLMHTTSEDLKLAYELVAEWLERLHECDRQLAEARALQAEPDGRQQLQQQQMKQQQIEHAAMLQKQQLQQQQLQQQQQQHQLQQQQRQMLMLEKEKQKQAMFMSAGEGSGIVCVRRSAGDGAVTLSIPGQPGQPGQRAQAPLSQLLQVLNVHEEPPPIQKPAETQRKQTWEQALAHINQLAKGSNKEKKKQKEAQQKAEAKVKEQKKSQPQPAPEPVQPLSKKQRRLLAKQQAEEEEKKRQQQEAKSKKENKKQEPPKPEPSKKTDKKTDSKKEQPKKEDKKEKKQDKEQKKGKENKQEKAVPAPATNKQNKQPTQQNSKKEKKKEQQQKPQVINITPDTTIEVISNKNQCINEPEKPASCSIMEQLSCGVQVADLKLPPGITLTRVQPAEKKDPPSIKSVPLWRCSQLAAPPTPQPRPPPVINADPSMMMFTTAQPEPTKPLVIPEAQPQPAGKSKKSKKKAKKAAAAAEEPKQDTKMVTLRNPMFHPNLPPVQITNAPTQKKTEIRIPEPIPMPPNACQATITPTSNGMYTIRNPLMSIMHQQSLMGMRPQAPNMYQPQYSYVNPNYPMQQTYVDPRASPKNQETEFQNRMMNLASFTQKNDEGYSLFKTTEENQQPSFLTPEYYENPSPKPTVSPNPIGTRPNNEARFESNDSLFANPIQRPEPIGTPLKRDENDFSGVYTPFGQESRNVFRNALFNDKNDVGSNVGKMDDVGPNHMANGDPLPYFQRLRVGSKLNNEVTIHHVTESKFFKGQKKKTISVCIKESEPQYGGAWADGLYAPAAAAHLQPLQPAAMANTLQQANVPPRTANPGSGTGSPTGDSSGLSGVSGVSGVSGASPDDENGFGAVGSRHPHARHHVNPALTVPMSTESSIFLPDRSITNLSALDLTEREIESFKRFDFYFEPPLHKPKVQFDVKDIAAALRHNK